MKKQFLRIFTISVILISFCSTANSQENIWSQIGEDIDGEAAGDLSGNSVSLSADGNTVAIGASGNNGNDTNAGHVRIYKYEAGIWTQLGQDIDGEAAYDNSGYSVSLSSDGNTVAIGAYGNDENGTDAGHARIYKYEASIWTQIGLDIDGEAEEDWSGYSVSLSADGSTVAIGAPYNDGAGTDAGHVRIYKYEAGIWTQVGQDIDGETAGDNSGYSVSLSSDGNTVAIGAYGNDGNSIDAGHVRIYQNNTNTWNQVGNDIDGEAADDWSGWSLSLSADGNTVAIGARDNDGNGTDAGHVRIYQNNNDTWQQIGLDIDGEVMGDISGYSVSLSSDGSIVAIGAPFNTYIGHVRVYKNISGTWTQIGDDIDGETTDDLSGNAVSLSADGNIVAIGAIQYTGDGTKSGYVKTYRLCDISPTITGIFEFCEGNSTTLDAGVGFETYSWAPTGDAQTISVNTAGTVTVTVTDANGCTGSDNAIVIENNPTIPVITANGEIEFCEGEAVTLTADQTIGLNWSNAETTQNISVTETGDYMVVYTDENSCEGTSEIISVVVNLTPEVPTISQADNLLASSLAESYQWYLNSNIIDNATSQYYTAEQTGFYTVEVNNEFGCSEISEMSSVVISNIESVNSAEISIYPNPSTGLINVTIANQNSETSILITDIIGKTIIKQQLNNTTTQFDLSEQPKGIYLIKVTEGENSKVEKIVIK